MLPGEPNGGSVAGALPPSWPAVARRRGADSRGLHGRATRHQRPSGSPTGRHRLARPRWLRRAEVCDALGLIPGNQRVLLHRAARIGTAERSSPILSIVMRRLADGRTDQLIFRRWRRGRRRRRPRLNPLSCKELVELVTDYLEGALDEPTNARFEEHIAGCDGCTEYVEQMRETIRLVGHVEESRLSQTRAEADGRFPGLRRTPGLTQTPASRQPRSSHAAVC